MPPFAKRLLPSTSFDREEDARVTRPKKASLSADKKKNNNKKHVSFGFVSIHHHETILGDNPGGDHGGAPLSIDWTCIEQEHFTVDRFEQLKESLAYGGPPHYVLTLSPDVRYTKLIRAGYSDQEIQTAIDEAETIRREREKSRNRFDSFPLAIRFSEMVQIRLMQNDLFAKQDTVLLTT